MRRRVTILVFLIALILGVVLRARDLLDSYENGHRGACAAFFALMARNHLRYGIVTTGGVAVLNPDRVDSEFFHYYLHHPPGAILLAWVGAALGGTNPTGLRLIFLPLSVGIVLLVYRLGRLLHRTTGAVAASVAALLPIAVYYGAFVNFEIPTLFFLLLTLHYYLRFLTRDRSRDRTRAFLAYTAAVGCDWIALGLPLCLLVLAPFHAAGERVSRSGAARLAARLLGVGTLTVAAVKTLYWLQLQRYGVDPDAQSGILYYLSATALSPGFTWTDYWERMSTYGRALFGLPALTLALLGLVAAAFRGFGRRLRPVDVAALSLTTIGLANVLILANHAKGHDYYLLYLMPAAAILIGCLFDLVAGGAGRGAGSPARFAVALAALIPFLGHLAYRADEESRSRESYLLSEVGQKLAAVTPVGSLVLLPHHYREQVAVSADRFVWHAKDMATFDQAVALALRFGMRHRPISYVVEENQVDTLDAGLRAFLKRRGPPEEHGPYLVYQLGVVKE